ncbi:DUF3363 domain-containing protein [Sphingomonas sp. ASV193]|uniref:DUF3363 domain-containing protein n=1 Tax=Sphingomonas sp. ASV193 TaxID=3144405 RepID=UPI0032E87830
MIVAAIRHGSPCSRGRSFGGSRIGRGAVAARLLGRHGGSRRGIVKTRLVRLAGRGLSGMRAHLRYLQRDAATREGTPGRLYDAAGEEVDGKAFLDRCNGDRHQFRIIVSAEDGHLYDDLKPLTRRFMARLEEDLGTRLDWVAVDHADTLHPHTHIVLRGCDERGRDLVIAPDYLAHGMRSRLRELVSLDLGPRTALEVAAEQRRDVGAERFTRLDRRLLAGLDGAGRVEAVGHDADDHSLLIGRLRKLERLGLASDEGGGRWRLDEEFETRLRALGERGDFIRTMQRALRHAGLERAPAAHRVDGVIDRELIGRVVARGLADELADRHFLLVDAIDGRTHYVMIGEGASVESLPADAIVRIAPNDAGVRAVDRTIAAVAAASGGKYDAVLHRSHDPGASAAFVEAHVRRLEALRRPLRLERAADGMWTIPTDHLERLERRQAALVRRRPVAVEILSPLPLEMLPARDGATWLDRELGRGEAATARDAGFGSEVRAALAARRAWLVERQLAEENEEGFALRRGALAMLMRRELLGAAAGLERETGKGFEEAGEGIRIEGLLRRRVDLAGGRFALVETERSFTLVPWRPVLDAAIGKEIGGVVRERGTNWTIGRARGMER